MDYFNNIENIEYNFNGEIVKLKNIFKFLYVYKINDNYITYYNIIETKNVEYISYDLYGTTEYWWVIMILNDIKDIIFDLPVSEEVINQIAENYTMEKYGEIDSNEANLFLIDKYEELQTENDKKRIIKIINPLYMNEFIIEILKGL